jgi:hypothetical protein
MVVFSTEQQQGPHEYIWKSGHMICKTDTSDLKCVDCICKNPTPT